MYRYLKGRMAMVGIDGKTLAEEIGLSPVSMSRKLNGHTDFSLSEMWKILRVLGAEPEEMASLFPEGGQDEVKVIIGSGWVLSHAGQRGRVGAERHRIWTIRDSSGGRSGSLWANRD